MNHRFGALEILTAIWVAGLTASLWIANDRITWAMEVFPTAIALGVMWSSRENIELTPLH